MNKQDFPILKENLVYLDNSATTQKPQQVIKAITDYYETYNSNVHRGIHKLSMQATLAYDDARETIAKFINANSEEIIFTSGTTESLNSLARTLVNKGDEILLTEMEHHSNIVPWQQIARERGAIVRFIPITNFKLDLEKAKEMITEKTKIVSLTHMSNVLGTINPIKEIIELAKNIDALTVIDAAQSIPHLMVDVKELDCDFLAFSGHKMCGPTGVGVLYGKKKLLEKLPPANFGGGMIKEVCYNNSSWADLPHKFEAGTPNISGAIGLAAAIKYLENIGMENIEKHSNEITKYALEKFSKLPGLKLIGPDNERGSVFSFNLEDIHSHDLSESLDNYNIAVRAGNHCAMPLMNKLNVKSAVRASFYFYNTKEDVDFLVNALQEIVNPINRSEITSSKLTEEQEIYKENIIDHYKNPHNKKELNGCSLSHKELNPICGDEITIYFKIDDNNVVTDVTFTGDGCAISQASVSMLTDYMKGMSVSDVKEVNSDKIMELLGIPISHTRIKCALLSLKTVHGALK